MATATAVRKLTMPMPLSLSAALFCDGVIPMPPEDVLVAPVERVSEPLRVSEADRAEEAIVLAMELARELTIESVPVADAVSVTESAVSVAVEDMLDEEVRVDGGETWRRRGYCAPAGGGSRKYVPQCVL